MSVRTPNYGKVRSDIMYDDSLSLEARGLYALLVCLQGADNHCYPTIRWICTKTGYQRTKVYSLLNELCSRGIVCRTRDALSGRTLTEVQKLQFSPSTHFSNSYETE